MKPEDVLIRAGSLGIIVALGFILRATLMIF